MPLSAKTGKAGKFSKMKLWYILSARMANSTDLRVKPMSVTWETRGPKDGEADRGGGRPMEAMLGEASLRSVGGSLSQAARPTTSHDSSWLTVKAAV